MGRKNWEKHVPIGAAPAQETVTSKKLTAEEAGEVEAAEVLGEMTTSQHAKAEETPVETTATPEKLTAKEAEEIEAEELLSKLKATPEKEPVTTPGKLTVTGAEEVASVEEAQKGIKSPEILALQKIVWDANRILDNEITDYMCHMTPEDSAVFQASREDLNGELSDNFINKHSPLYNDEALKGTTIEALTADVHKICTRIDALRKEAKTKDLGGVIVRRQTQEAVPVTPETVEKSKEGKKASQETPKITEETVRTKLSPKNQGVYDKMSAGGKKMMKQADESILETSAKIYEGSLGMTDRTIKGSGDAGEEVKKFAGKAYDFLYKIPGVKRVLGKMEIGYNQMWINTYEGSAAKDKDKMDDADLEIALLDKSKGTIETIIENLRKKGMSTASMELEIKDIERQKNKLLFEKNKAQSKLEERENKAKIYTNERDRVADKLIGSYNEKLAPLERRLESLQTGRDRMELQLTVVEARQKEEIAELDSLAKDKKEIEEGYRMLGWDEKKIAKQGAIKSIEKRIAEDYERIRKERAAIVQKKEKIDKQIAKFDEEASPIRDEREEMIRIKEGRPLKIEVEERKERADFTGTEETMAHTRNTEPPAENLQDAGGEEVPEAGESVATEDAETGEKEVKVENWTTEELLSSWNNYLDERYGKEAASEKIDPKDFFNIVESMGSSKNSKPDFESFVHILRAYCKFNKMPVAKLNESISAFYEDKIAEKE